MNNQTPPQKPLTVQEAKDEVAKRYNQKGWDNLLNDFYEGLIGNMFLNIVINEAMELYHTSQSEKDHRDFASKIMNALLDKKQVEAFEGTITDVLDVIEFEINKYIHTKDREKETDAIGTNKLEEVDDILANLEDHLHGVDGRSITEARKLLIEYKKCQPKETDAVELKEFRYECSDCGRKTCSDTLNTGGSLCDMPQPNGQNCKGVFLPIK